MNASILIAAAVFSQTARTPPAAPEAPPPSLTIPEKLAVKLGDPIVIVANTTARNVTWVVPRGVEIYDVDRKRLPVKASDGSYKCGKTVAFWVAEPGAYQLKAVIGYATSNDDGAIASACILTVTGPRPPPVPPDPGPTPTPPPIPVDGFRVLIVYETSAPLTPTQHSIVFGKRVRDYLTSHCVKGDDGKTPEARIFDKDIDASSDSALWQDAMKRPRTAIPWILISTGKTGFEGPLPATVDETLALLKKYGGE